MKSILIIILSISLLSGQSFSIARVHYGGGGDWYSNASSLPNLLRYIEKNTTISVHNNEYKIKLTTENLNLNPYLYLNGHGNIKFNDDEVIALRSALVNGSFLHADDNYGMDKSFRREMKKVFPNKDFVNLSNSHPLFNSYYNFPNGLPKIHEHDNKPPQALALFEGEKMIVLYTYESDLGDGWEDGSVHQDPWPIRESALKMGVNIIYFALTQ
tara:strand:+ start:2245 stop:2886 length:642 start_codon:yes stop_codon:yes gene_type:complete